MRKRKIDNLLNTNVRVFIKDGRSIIGHLLSCDKHMNLVVADAEEQRITKQGHEFIRTLGLIVLRGVDVITVSAETFYPLNKNPSRVPVSIALRTDVYITK